MAFRYSLSQAQPQRALDEQDHQSRRISKPHILIPTNHNMANTHDFATPMRPQTSPDVDLDLVDPIVPRSQMRRKRGQSMHSDESGWHNSQHTPIDRQMSDVHHSRVSTRHSIVSTRPRKDVAPRDGILRKTSQTCKRFQKAISSKSRRSSIDGMEGVESTGTPESSHAPQHRGLFDRVSSNRMLSNLKVSRYDTPQPLGLNAARNLAPIVPSSHHQHNDSHFPLLSPVSPLSFEPKEYAHAARSANTFDGSRLHFSAAQESPSYLEVRDEKRHRLGSLSSAADSGADLGSNTFDAEMLDVSPAELKLDPVSYLPVEVNSIIFSYLDADSLRTCQSISSWRPFASDTLTWRNEFLRRYEKKPSPQSAPIQIGGMGLGKPESKMQQWEKMYTARTAIDENWAAGKGRAVYMAGHTDSVYCVQFDETKIITGSRDRTIRVWDINTNRCIKVIGGPNVRPSPGPRVLRTVDYPHFHHAEASVNGLPYGHHIYHVPSDYHSASILCLQYDDKILVTGSSDNDLIVWDIKTYEPVERLRHHHGGVLDVAFDADHIVSCSKDCTIVVWDRKTLRPLKTLTGHNGPVNAVQLRGNLLVSASGDGVARLWDLTKMKCIREFAAKERGLAAVEFSDDAKYVLAGGNDHLTYKFEVATGKEVLQYAGHTELVRSLYLDTQNKRVVSGSYDLDLRVYDYESGKLITVFPQWTTSWMLAAKCDYRRIVSTSQDGRVLMIDFGLDADGKKIEGLDLLAGVMPVTSKELYVLVYPYFWSPTDAI